LIFLLLGFLTAAGAMAEVRVGIAADGGRNAATGEGLEADAVPRLLGCPVERSLGGFRCRERTILGGLEFSGKLDFSALPPGPVTVLMPSSPLSDVAGFERQPAGWWPSRVEIRSASPSREPVAYRLGFSWVIVLTDMIPLAILLYWLVRWPEPRWGLAAALSVWLMWLSWSGTLAVDSFFWYVPSVEGAFLRWVSWLPLCLLIVAQARWMGMPAAAGVWLPIAVLVLLRPRSAQWMTSGEQVLSIGLSFGLLALVAGPIVLRGRDRALLPRPLRRPLGEFDIRLDKPPDSGIAPHARLGRMVTIPPVWLERFKGDGFEVAVLLACMRARYTPMAAVLVALVAAWVLLSLPVQRVPWSVGLVPVVACAAFTPLERRWDRLVAHAAIRLGEQPAVLQQVLLAIRPEWGEAAVRVSERLPR
jgi:hypothetical protein